MMRFLFVSAVLLFGGSRLDAKSPNVLFIAIDDLRVELGCYGAHHIISPNIDKLAERGMTFERAYCQQAVCNPSRASVLTGLRPSTLGIFNLGTHFREQRPDIVTLPQHFKNHGYSTRGIGKIFHNWAQKIQGDPVSWSVPEVLHYNTHGADTAQVKGELPPNLSDVPKCVIRDVPDEAYFDGRIAQLAVDALSDLADHDENWFLAVGFWKPHAHFNAPKKYWDLYDRDMIGRAENLEPPTDVPPIALHDGREIMRDFKSRPGGKLTESDEVALRHGYYANLSYMDAQVGKVLDAVDANGLRDSTIIVFWSDHGYHLGESSLWAKTSNFELDAHVPLIIEAPGRTGGQRTASLVELLDIYPTLVDLCGLPSNDSLEGTSLRPILDNPDSTVKSVAYTWHPRPAYSKSVSKLKVMGYSMRTDRYRFTEWRDAKSDEVVAQELYDHKHDARETVNIADKKRKVAKKLSDTLRSKFPLGSGIQGD